MKDNTSWIQVKVNGYPNWYTQSFPHMVQGLECRRIAAVLYQAREAYEMPRSFAVRSCPCGGGTE